MLERFERALDKIRGVPTGENCPVYIINDTEARVLGRLNDGINFATFPVEVAVNHRLAPSEALETVGGLKEKGLLKNSRKTNANEYWGVVELTKDGRKAQNIVNSSYPDPEHNQAQVYILPEEEIIVDQVKTLDELNEDLDNWLESRSM